MNDINILAFFNLKIEELDKYELLDSSNEGISFRIRLKKDIKTCMNCGSCSITIKDYKNKKYSFYSIYGKKIVIFYEQRRYKCKDCGTTFLEKNPFVKNKNRKLSGNKIGEIINYLKDGLTVSLISKYTFVSESSIHDVIDKYVHVRKAPISDIVAIDEFCSFNSAVETKYACVLLNYQKREIIDVLPSRRSNWLCQYLSTIDKNDLNRIKYVVMDMYKPYKDCFRKFNNNIAFIIDPFHYIRYVTDAIEKIRIRTMKRFPVDSVEYKLLKKYSKILLTKHEPDTYRKLFKISCLNNGYFYSSDILKQLLAIDEDIKEAYFLGHEFLRKLDSLDYEGFKHHLQIFINKFKMSNLDEFIKVGKTFENWQIEIENSYLLVDNGKRLSNGRIEGINNKIKTLKKTCYGLTNFNHLRKRIFLIFEKTPR